MRLFEIITHTKTSEPRGLSDEERLEPKKHGLVGVDDSNFSFVQSDEDPHMVRKYNKSEEASRQDGFAKYVEFIVRFKLWDNNVHFPRVYNTNVVQGGDYGDPVYDWTIEKLLDWDAVSVAEYDYMNQRYFGESVNDEPRLLIQDMASRILNALRGDTVMSNEVRDPDLITAMEVLKQIKDYAGFVGYDIHKDNIMFRRTPVGMQLVFNDPFGFAP